MVGLWVLGVIFIGVFLCQISVSLVDDHGVGELFHGVSMSSMYETVVMKSTWILCLLCIVLSTMKFVLPILNHKSVQQVTLDLLDDFEHRLTYTRHQVRVALESGRIANFVAVDAELTWLIDDIEKAKRRRHE